MKNSALKILSLMTLTFAIACGHDPASPMITEIETVVLYDYEVNQQYFTEIDYRNGNEKTSSVTSYSYSWSPYIHRYRDSDCE